MCSRLSPNANDDGLPLLTSAGDYTLDEMMSHMMGGGGQVAGNGHSSVASRKRKQGSTPLGLQDLAACLWEQEEEEERADDVTLDEYMAQFQDPGIHREGGGSGESEEGHAKRAKCTPHSSATMPTMRPPTMRLPTMHLPTMLKGVNSAPTPTRQLSMSASAPTRQLSMGPIHRAAASPLACPGTSSSCSAHSVAASASLPSSDASHHGPVLGQKGTPSDHHFKGCFPPATPPAAPPLCKAAPNASSSSTGELALLGCRASTSQKRSSPVGSLSGMQSKRSWGRTLQEGGIVAAPGVLYKEANRPVGLLQNQALVVGPGYQTPYPFGLQKFAALRSDTWSLALLQQKALAANVSLQRSMLHEAPGVCKQKRVWGKSLEPPNSTLETSAQLSREVRHP